MRPTLSFIGRKQPSVELLNDGVSRSWDAWSVPNSLREVEREVNFLLDATDPNRDAAPEYELDRGSTRERAE